MTEADYNREQGARLARAEMALVALLDVVDRRAKGLDDADRRELEKAREVVAAMQAADAAMRARLGLDA